MLPYQTLNSIIHQAKIIGYPCSNKEYEIVAEDIYTTLGDRLGINTLKRMFGKLNDNVTPTQTSLNIIARYLGYCDWDTYEESLINDSIHFSHYDETQGKNLDYVCTDNLNCGAYVEFCYEPDGRMRLRYIGNYRFVIMACTCNSLQIGDILEIRYFQNGCTLISHTVTRQGICINNGQILKIACLRGGISFLKVE
ncbi:MAG: hypothetical protein U0L77_06850 [Prevotellamassilia sp.]|nr:hypothetical protein [Prevotellamassilia sp.]